MIVVADTSPLNYLIQIECVHLLPALYGEILVPTAVMQELAHSGAPAAVRDWSRCPPSWVEIDSLADPGDIGLAFLDPGEREAIQISLARKADLLLMDERRGRLEAERRGLKTTGILGILLTAGERDLVDGEVAFHRLRQETNFRVSAVLVSQFLDRIRKER